MEVFPGEHDCVAVLMGHRAGEVHHQEEHIREREEEDHHEREVEEKAATTERRLPVAGLHPPSFHGAKR